MDSTRFYGKPLEKINGTMMVEHVYRAVVGCPWVDGVCVATEDYEIVMECYMQEVPCICTDEHVTGSDRVFEATQQLGIKRGIILNVQGDEPLIQHEHIRTLLGLFEDNSEVQVGTLVRQLSMEECKSNDVVKVRFDGGGRVYAFHREAPLNAGSYYGSIGLMGYKIGSLADFARLPQSDQEKSKNIELQRLIDNNIPVHCAISDIPTIGVDRKEDIARVEDEINRRSVCN
jgi:3-deoxy-manno-octulosonate cytidylyltransferase (CMP-KDO synthetase)